MRPFFSYYGGKWRDSLRNYPAPAFDTVIEPFAGSAGYATRYFDRKVILCELDPVVAGVWRYLLRARPAEIRGLPDLAESGTVEDLDVVQEARWLIGFWLNRGVSSPRKRPSRWMRDGIRPGSFWGERVRETIASQVEKIRHWKIIEGDYTRCAEFGPATWFVDPPYEEAGKHYRHGSSAIDYPELATWCTSRQGQVIVCEKTGASWLPFSAVGTTKTTRKDRRSAEAVWCSQTTTGQLTLR